MIQTVAGNKNFDYVIIALSNQGFVEKKQNKATGDASKITFSEQQRLEMMFEMTYRIPNVLIFGIEHGYTYEVLHQIKEEYDIDNLYFAMGSDKLNEVSRWGYHDKLLKEFGFYVMKRGNDTDEETNEKCRILSQYIIGNDDERYKDISSTLVREKIYNAQDYSKLVDNNVKSYIDICSKNQPKKNGG
jgi:nicotinate (nicotinamide) nucleotide adenylyltransferase